MPHKNTDSAAEEELWGEPGLAAIQLGLRRNERPEAVYEKVLHARIVQLRRYLDDLATHRLGDFRTVSPDGSGKKLRDFGGKILDSDHQEVKREAHGLFFELEDGSEGRHPELHTGWGITREGRLVAIFISSELVRNSQFAICRRVTEARVEFSGSVIELIALLKRKVRKPLNVRQPRGNYTEGEWPLARSMVGQISGTLRKWRERRAELYTTASNLLEVVDRQDEQLAMFDHNFRWSRVEN